MILPLVLAALVLQPPSDAPLSTAPPEAAVEAPAPLLIDPPAPLAVPPATPATPSAAVETTEEEEPAPAVAPPPAPPVLTPGLPAGPQPYAAPPGVVPGLPARPQPYAYPPVATPPAPTYTYPIAPPGARATIDQPTGPGFPTPEEARYEASVRTSALAAQSRRGPLDGGWLVSGADGARLYALQLVDNADGDLQGAWRDPSAPATVRSGFLVSAIREGVNLTLRFFEKQGEPPVTLTLTPGVDGRSWRGELDRAGAQQPVEMRPV